ncbi:MAG TPA: hypothetical protein VM056_04610 [Terriglobales bacterium]|nr:hypothetical protein [Terriglobales bacterium]
MNSVRNGLLVAVWAMAAVGALGQSPTHVGNATQASLTDVSQAQTKPLPEIATLLRDAQAHQKQMETMRRNYIYKVVEVEDDVDGDGKVKESTTEEREVFYIGRSQISRLLKKNGKELTEKEQEKEKERVEKAIESSKKRQAKRDKDEEEGKKSENEITVETFLRVCKFTNPRRETFKGRDTILFDFAGDQNAKAKGMAENALKKLSGTLWIDEAGREVARMEVRFEEAFKIGGGLVASIQKGSKFTFEQALINDEVWLPTYMEGQIAARVLLLKGIRQHSTSWFSDYRKFRASTTISLADENQ